MKKRIQVSLDPELIKTAKQTMAQRRFGKNFSGFLESLIREEWERREQGKSNALIVPPAEPGATSRLNEPVKYPPIKRK